MLDWNINFLHLRSSSVARLVRHGLSSILLGPDAWPIEFRAPANPESFRLAPSADLYFHIPFCRTICPHCPYVKHIFTQRAANAYQSALLREYDHYLGADGTMPIHTLYFGGGTPGLCPELIGNLLERSKRLITNQSEVGIELHPLDCTQPFLEWLKKCGFTHLSLGVESLQPSLLNMLGRGYTAALAKAALGRALDCGFECVDVNLIFGIPGQDPKQAVDDAIKCVEFGAHQISAYPLIAFENTRLGERCRKNSDNRYGVMARFRTQRLMARAMEATGMERNSIWSFTRRGVSPFTTVTRPNYRGFGIGAGSLVDGVFSFNTFDLKAYCRLKRPRTALALVASERMRRLHWFYWSIYRLSIDSDEYRDLFGRDLDRDFGALIRTLSLLGFASHQGNTWRLNDRGADWIHRLQSLYSLTFIDQMWTRCRNEPWPDQVLLE